MTVRYSIIQHIRQEDDWGCGVAVLAMLLGQTYQQTKAEVMADPRRVDHDWSKHGLYVTDLDLILTMRGFWMRRLYSGWDLNPWPPEPFAPSHFAIVRQPSGNSHMVAVDHLGTVLDPMVDHPRSLDEWERVDQVTGIGKVFPSSGATP